MGKAEILILSRNEHHAPSSLPAINEMKLGIGRSEPGHGSGQKVEPFLHMHPPEEQEYKLVRELGMFGFEERPRGKPSKSERSTPLGTKQIGVQGAILRRCPISGRG